LNTPEVQGGLGLTKSSGLNLSALKQSDLSGGMSDRERALRQELADIEAAKLNTSTVFQQPFASSSSMGYQAPLVQPHFLWESNPKPESLSLTQRHNSGNLMTSSTRENDQALLGVSSVISMVTTLPTIDLVSIASYETLTKLREQMEAHVISGGHNLDRNTFFTKGTRRTIYDTLKHIYIS
jgi:hypothetical protein